MHIEQAGRNNTVRSRCRLCSNERVLSYRRAKKKWCIDYLGGKCQVCGYNKCVNALEFHHRDPKEKEFQFSEYMRKTNKELALELDKCDLLCSNCHREKHAEDWL